MSIKLRSRRQQTLEEQLDLLAVRPVDASASRSKQELMEEKLDRLEAQMLAKADLLSGFAAEYGKVRKLTQILKFHDKNDSGYTNLTDFADVLNKFNLVGVQREAEEIFNRYDEDMVGNVDCKELAMRLYKVEPYCALSPSAKATLSALRAALLGKHEYTGLRYCRAAMRLESLDVKGCVAVGDLVQHILPRTGHAVSRRDFTALLSELDTRPGDRVLLQSYLKLLKVTPPPCPCYSPLTLCLPIEWHVIASQASGACYI